MTRPGNRLTEPPRMTRMQPDSGAWTWKQYVLYHADLTLDLYVQGRSIDEVARVTVSSPQDVRDLVVAAGVLRDPRTAYVLARWRDASRVTLARTSLTDLLYAWMDGVEVDDLADKHGVPVDLMWDAIAGEMARTARTDLRRRPADRPSNTAVPCRDRCTFACVHTCCHTVPDPHQQRRNGPTSDHHEQHCTWPPRAQVNEQVVVGPEGHAAWRTITQLPG